MAMAGRRGLIFDLALGAVLGTLLPLVSRSIPPAAGERALDELGTAIVAASGLVLALRRFAPRTVLAVTTALLIAYTRFDYAGGPIYLTMAVPLYTLSTQAPDRRSAIQPSLIAVAAIIAGGTIAVDEIEWTWHVAVFPGWAAAALFLGEAVRNRREYLRGLEERARNLEETREEEARRRVAEERLRIARDLHDVVAHTIATVNLQAGVAAHVIDRRPEDAAEALEVIKRTSSEALHELRATLDLLRGDGDETAPREPTSRLDQLDLLVDRARRAGIDVEVERTGVDGSLPIAVDVAAYRIVQESLTNVMRHAGATRTKVAIRRSADHLDVEVLDNGRGASARDGDGHGIAGMRERAHLAGGSLEAGPRQGGGYRVWARLPLEAGT